MKKQNKYISFFFAAVIAFGVTVSSVHVHFDNFHDVETEHVLVQEELGCEICGSAFKFNPAGNTFVFIEDIPETFFFEDDFKCILSPAGTLNDSRAPPFYG